MRGVFAILCIWISAQFFLGGKQCKYDCNLNKSVSYSEQAHNQNLAAFHKIKELSKTSHVSAVKYKKSKVKGLKISEITIAISFLKKVVYVNKTEPLLIQKDHSNFLYCVDQKRGPPYGQI